MKYLNTKPGSIEEIAANMSKYATESEYQQMFKKELEKAGKGIGSMTPAEKKAFFNKIDSKYTAKNEKVNEGITSPSGQISQKNKDLLKVNNYITVKGKVYVIDKVSLKDGVYTMKAFDENGKMHTISSKDVDSVEHWKASLKVASFDPKNEAVKEPYAVGMAAAMKQTGDKPPLKKSTITKAHDIAKSIEKDQKEDYSKKDVDKFHTSLDKLVHKSLGHSSDEKKKEMKKEEKDVPKGYHKMPDGKIMKDSEHKKEEVKETHSFVTNKQNQKQKDAGGEKDIVDPAPEMRKESLRDAIKSVWQMSAEQLEKIKSEAKYYKKESDTKKKNITDLGTTPTPVDTTPNVDYTN